MAWRSSAAAVTRDDEVVAVAVADRHCSDGFGQGPGEMQHGGVADGVDAASVIEHAVAGNLGDPVIMMVGQHGHAIGAMAGGGDQAARDYDSAATAIADQAHGVGGQRMRPDALDHRAGRRRGRDQDSR